MVGSGKRVGLLMGVAWLGFGCGEGAPTPEDAVSTEQSALTVSFTLPLFVGSNPSDLTLAASHTLSINDRASVREIGIGVTDNGFVSNLGIGVPATTAGTGIGTSVAVGTILSRPLVSLRSNAKVAGSLYQGVNAAPVQQTGVTVSGITKTNIGYTTDTTWSKTVTWPSAFNPTPNLDANGQPFVVPLAPGAYHAVDVKTGRLLRLSSGQYFLDSLIIEPGAVLSIDGGAGPVYVNILDGGFVFRGEQREFATTPPLGFASLTIMTTGSVSIEQPFSAVVMAPNGQVGLRINAHAGHLGAWFGKDVTVFEDNVVQHRRDPFSFQGFTPVNGLGDRVSVTGGSIRRPGRDATDEGGQNESVTAISRNASNSVVTVGYNDMTIDPLFPTLIYGASTTVDPRDGTGRLIKKGQTLMGWSFSQDGGRTFTYGGRVAPPSGWSLIWGDSAISKLNIDDPNVYYAQISGTTTAFEATWDPTQQAIVSNGQNVAQALDGYCISRSTDRGVNFNAIGCISPGFQDGTALAVGMDQGGHRQAYVAGSGGHVFRMDGETMTFSPANTIADPLAGQSIEDHPRMRVFNGTLYYAQEVFSSGGDVIMVNRLDAAHNATTWLGAATVMCGANPCRVLGGSAALGNGNSLAVGPVFSFDFGADTSNQTKFRIMYTAPDGANLRSVAVAECALDLTNCRSTGWSSVGDPGEEINPSLRFSGGQWVSTWRKIDPGSPLNGMRHVVGHLNVVGATETLEQKTLYPDVMPCFYNKTQPGFVRLGEYDLIDGFGDGRFFAPYSTPGPGCRWQGTFVSDSHIGGSVFSF